jgi:carbon storage regulator
MLILTRKPGESLYIGDNVKVTIVEIKGNQIRVGIDAPSELRIYREEIYVQILEENKKAAEAEMSGSALDQLSGSWKGVARTVQPEKRSLKTSRTSIVAAPTVEPKVFVKRKKRRDDDEDGEVPPNDEGES